MRAISIAAIAVAVGIVSSDAHAQDSGSSLSQQLANPIADLTSVPIQYNFLVGAGPNGNGTISFLNIQPIIPIRLNEDWNLITRTILPVAYVRNVFKSDVGGLGDTQMSLFLSPQRPGPGGLIWGVGAIINVPTATDSRLGTRKWGAGPTAVALVQKGPWTVGALANQLWTFGNSHINQTSLQSAGNVPVGQGDINQTFLQPWVTYELSNNRSVTLTSQSSYDWIDNEWTVPLNLTFQQWSISANSRCSFRLAGSTPSSGRPAPRSGACKPL